jgi:oxygen-independent coproporphyrinogen-3 oxidase
MLPSVFATTPVEELRRLVESYSTAVPRYTSYPTAVEFHSGVGATDWAQQCVQDSARYGATTSVALYVHVPFCHSLCYFCACNKKIVKDDSEVGPYLEAVGAEVRTYGEILRTSPALQQLHWGGGTPNFLSPTATEELFGLCREVFPEATANADISVEIDPRTVTPAHLETYRRLGFTRVSAGVQDFCLDVQEAINRVQPYELTKEICDGVRSLGFSGLNLDLIYGLPEQTEATFADTIEKVLTIRPDRIALYGYAHVTWKKKVQRSLERHSLPSPDTRIRLFLQALGSLTRAGYVYIGMDHFALPDDSLSLA